MTGRTVRARDGIELAVAITRPEGRPVARAVLLHAMMVDARSLDRPRGRGLATALAAAGIEAWRADFRGHGGSPCPTWTYDDLVRLDVPALVAAARAEGGPVVVVGHSLGGHVAAAAVAEGLEVDALVLLAVNVWRPSRTPSRRARLLQGLVMRSFEATARGVGRFPSRRLGVGTADEAAPYVRDLTRFWRRDVWGSRDGVDWGAALAARRLPVLTVAGAGDRWMCPPEGARRFADVFPPGCVDAWVERAGERGCPWDPDHVGLACDERSRPVWDRVAGWIRAHSGAAVSPVSSVSEWSVTATP